MSDSTPQPADPGPVDLQALEAAILSGDPARSMPALVGLREVPAEQAVPLLLRGLEQSAFIVRSLSCAGLGVKQTEAGWTALVEAVRHDEDANVRAEAANALVSYGLQRAWPVVLEAFRADSQWLLRCSVLSAVAEHPEARAADLLELAELALADADDTVRVGGTEILGRLAQQQGGSGDDPAVAERARTLLRGLQQDADHRVVAAALNGLQG
ncbi:HEAT repeat domain-containing protein [Cyanobium sp. NIES-981]|uniref:HEAT repeat domain-containing protein n=1 Tax=Cyanobium sp. NIES-981 TaxID=1851505 RepID=UPI0007DD1FA8|nr:HEAT repeat domain-containing protein [Cyanobium sp. NIES-981]SBO43978.1 CotB mutant [Cyanobium sp. NIES-981]